MAAWQTSIHLFYFRNLAIPVIKAVKLATETRHLCWVSGAAFENTMLSQITQIRRDFCADVPALHMTQEHEAVIR